MPPVFLLFEVTGGPSGRPQAACSMTGRKTYLMWSTTPLGRARTSRGALAKMQTPIQRSGGTQVPHRSQAPRGHQAAQSVPSTVLQLTRGPQSPPGVKHRFHSRPVRRRGTGWARLPPVSCVLVTSCSRSCLLVQSRLRL